ncbi:MAG TPA: hypothetical protein VK993_16995 [Chthoniobacterales bacterium]|nr:hypothetical protein [Chthoniobacterales bacterium]
MVRALQCFFVLLLLAAPQLAHGDPLPVGETHRLTFRDVDGNDLSTADGHVTIIAVVTRRSEDQARAISTRVPEHCIGNPKYRYVTLVNFQRGLAGPFQGITRAVIRGRLDDEAKRLQPKYAAKRVTRDARRDLYVVADFDGSAVTRLGMSPESNDVAVFIFDGSGKLVQRWTGVPPKADLAKAVAAAER